jgi:N-hydroxyarylamine O-acetyltransferase
VTTLDMPAFLRRVGLTRAEAPSVEALTRLHRAFVERVPYETIEIQLGRATTIDPRDSIARVLRGRGGYCFHLNGVLHDVLQALGYHVTRHAGGVQMTPDHQAGINRNHLALTVRDLPDSDDAWLVDAGMGDGLHEPLPLREGTYRQGPFTYGLRPSEVAPGGWRFDHDRRGSFLGMDFAPEPVTMAAFTDRHEHLSTSPESGFVRTLSVLRVDAGGWDVLRALTLSRIGETKTKTVLETPADWSTALADVYGLTFSPDERDALWRKAHAQHEAHVRPTVKPSS